MNSSPHTSTTTTLNWDDLRIILAIVEHVTLSGAAGLRISHPTLSRRLRRIEHRLGFRFTAAS